MNEQDTYQEINSVVNRIRKCKMESESVFRGAFDKYYPETKKFKTTHKNFVSKDIGGIPLGFNEIDNSISIDSSDVHSLIIGSTGSKKSRLVIMPTVNILTDAGESMIISDPKAEIYDRTAKIVKESGYNIYVINLRNPSIGDAWNPLAIPYKMYKEGAIDTAYEFVNDISINLMMAEISEKDPYWDHSARDLFFGLTLTLFKYCKEHNEPDEQVNIRNLLRLRMVLFSEFDKENSNKLKDFIKKDEIIWSSLIGTIWAPEKTQSCILSVFDEKMRPFMIQPNLLDMLSYNDIGLDHIGFKKSAVYLIMPDEKTSYHKLITLFVKQSYEYLIFKAQSFNEGKMPIRVNYILDEFSSLPVIGDFPAMITAARSRNIRFNLVIQSNNQLVKRYSEEAETIFTNCNNWIFLTSREVLLLEKISKLCGVSHTTGKPIIPPAALQHLDKNHGEALIISGRLFPFISKLKDISYYDNNNISNLKLPSKNRKGGDCIIFNFETKKVLEVKEDIEFQTTIQEKLERKLNELFGISEENNN